MNAVIEFILTQGGWGAWFLTVSGGLYLIVSGKLVTLKHHESRLSDFENRLENEQREKEWLWDALLSSTEMGAIITKAKAPATGERRHSNDDG